MSNPLSTCCNAATEIVSYHTFKVDGVEIHDTGYRCLKCGHVMKLRTTDKTNKLAPEVAKDGKK